MKLVDLKSVVKESLREAFYTRKATLLESLIGYKFQIIINGEAFAALISKNTRPGEKEYRISFFYPHDLKPVNHWDMTKEEMEYTLKNKELPERFNKSFINYHISPPQLIFEKTLNEELFGVKMKVVYMGCEYDALISKNTIPGELPFRFTWFDKEGNDVTPLEHHDLTSQDIEYVLQYKRFPNKMLRKFGQWGAPEIVSIDNIATPAGPQLATAENLNEVLFFLENSARQLDLFIENKLPIKL
jgi:hypothetical protein